MVKKTVYSGEELLRTLFDAMPDIVCFKDGSGRWLEANKAGLELFQLQGVAYAGKKDSELAAFSPFYQEAFLTCEASDEAAWQTGEATRGEETVPLPGGGHKVFETYKIPLFHGDGSRKGLVVLGRDISFEQQAKEELQQLRRQEETISQLLRLGFRNVSLQAQLSEALDIVVSQPWLHFAPQGGIFLVSKTDPEALTLFVHKNMDSSLLRECREIGFGECLCGMAARDKDIIYAPTLPQENLYRYGGEGEQPHCIVPIVHLEKLHGVLMLYGGTSFLWNEGLRSFMKTVAGTLAMLIEQQEAEDRLQRSEANLLKAQEIARLGYWEWWVTEKRLFWPAEACRIFAWAPGCEPSSYDSFVESIYSDDRQRFQNTVQQAIIDKEPFKIQHRLIDAKGEPREVLEEGEVECDADGSPVRMFGTIQDITRRKQNEKQLALAAKVFESSLEGITITDADGIILSVNKAFTHITGYSREEAIGERPNILRSNRHDQAFYETMWATLGDTGQWEGEIWNRRKNGEIYPEWLTITTILDEYGQISHYIGVFRDLTEIHEYKEQIHFQAYHDTLTLLPNRLLLLDRFKVALRHARRVAKHVAILYLDLDNFKHINDSLGHLSGDELLQQVAVRLKEHVRAENTVARLGGDDFAVLIEQSDDINHMVFIAERILKLFSVPFNLITYETFVTVSVGVSYFPDDGNEAETLLKNAEMAMYRAKREGKNKYQFYAKSMNAAVIHRLSLENNLRKALDRDEFQVYYQPKVSAASGEIVGMEALVRWQKQDGRLISPLDFIPLAEETGLIVPIGEYVLRRACLDTRQWLKLKENLSVSVNLSARQFMEEGLLEMIGEILAVTGFPAQRLELEITESVVMSNAQAAIEQLRELKKRGVRLALDDFGTGYSSFQYLRRMPMDTLKIDRSFVKDLPDDGESSAIATAILSLAQALHIEVVAEGVETQAQLAFFQQQASKELQIQGYLFSPPVPAADFLERLQRKRPYDVLGPPPEQHVHGDLRGL